MVCGKYVCVSGAEASKEIKDAKTIWVWIFCRYKTRKGCDSYFDGECDINCSRMLGLEASRLRNSLLTNFSLLTR